jgi:hypothetical protein
MTVDFRSGQVLVAGAFDDLRAKQIRFLEEAAKLAGEGRKDLPWLRQDL